MKKIIISTIVITALSTFWITKSILNSNGDHHHNEHAEHHGNHHDEIGDEHSSAISITPEILKEFGRTDDLHNFNASGFAGII